MRRIPSATVAIVIAAGLAAPGAAQDAINPEGLADAGRPYSHRAFPTEVYFGDTVAMRFAYSGRRT